MGGEGFLVLGYFFGWLPWLVLGLCAPDRSVLPCRCAAACLGTEQSPAFLQGNARFPSLLGGLSLWMLIVLGLARIPNEAFQVPVEFCVEPRTGRGLASLHHACWNHPGFGHYAVNQLLVWMLGSCVLVHGRRTFVSSVLFTSFWGYVLLWLGGPAGVCISGFGVVLFGWFSLLSIGFVLEKPPSWGSKAAKFAFARIAIWCCAGICLVAKLAYEASTGDEHQRGFWHGDICGLISGAAYGYLHFRRGWFLCSGMEDRIIAPSASASSIRPTLQGYLGALSAEAVYELGAGVKDLKAIVTMQPPESLQLSDGPFRARAAGHEVENNNRQPLPPDALEKQVKKTACRPLEIILEMQTGNKAAPATVQSIDTVAKSDSPHTSGAVDVVSVQEVLASLQLAAASLQLAASRLAGEPVGNDARPQQPSEGEAEGTGVASL
eukprot:gnl/TRDRNA2_/TRDRNA2_170146_c1_seq2.p1 gnl/TRDRNA2_/TRDRNA2_170146_c1~~gnl/TRDRNA2_/TRDRNA2_170146_c1_seq2.p1  ORF type:complete len:453 (+),score=53.70 gnl/TRDRNA2_/TRDRNA2_170146_c1_seq2:53-1360(+)